MVGTVFESRELFFDVGVVILQQFVNCCKAQT